MSDVPEPPYIRKDPLPTDGSCIIMGCSHWARSRGVCARCSIRLGSQQFNQIALPRRKKGEGTPPHPKKVKRVDVLGDISSELAKLSAKKDAVHAFMSAVSKMQAAGFTDAEIRALARRFTGKEVSNA